MASAYVYSIAIDGVVRYIGKGRRYRVREHYRIARLLIQKRLVGQKIKVNRFYNRLAAAMDRGCGIDERIVADRLSDEAAFALERATIAGYPAEQLWNSGPGGEGFTTESAKAKWTPERRARQSEIAKRRWADPEERKRHGETIKQQWADPAYRTHHIEKQKERWARPGAKERGRLAASAHWTPETRAERSEVFKRMWKDPNVRERRSEAAKAMWADPAFKERMRLERKARWEVPGARERQSIAQKNRRDRR